MTTPAEPNSKYRLAVKKPSLLTLIVLISYGSIGASLFTPAIPAIMDHFEVSASVAQLTVMLSLLSLLSFTFLFLSSSAKDKNL